MFILMYFCCGKKGRERRRKGFAMNMTLSIETPTQRQRKMRIPEEKDKPFITKSSVYGKE
jgi:hypothetical protein